MKNSRRAAAASALMLALAAWLGGAADSVLLAAHRALSANLGPTARAWDRDREGQSAENSSTTQGGRATAVILGYALSPDGQAGPGLAARARTGADLYAAGAVTALICSGGHPGGGLPHHAAGGPPVPGARAAVARGAPLGERRRQRAQAVAQGGIRLVVQGGPRVQGGPLDG